MMFVLISSTLLFSVMSGNAVTGASTEEITHCPLRDYCITLTKGEIRAEEGLCVVIPCSFTSSHLFTPKQSVWHKCITDTYTTQCNTVFDSNNVRLRGRVSLLDPNISNKNCSIIINNLRMLDSGLYTLSVNGSLFGREDGLTFPLRATVSVTALSQKPTVTVPPLIEGQETKLTCTAPGLCPGPGPEITWTWRGPGHEDSHIPGNITLMTEKLTDFAKRHSSTLTFNPTAEHRGTEVTCKVSFKNGIATEETVTLNVTYVKEVEISGNTAVKEGDALNVTCSIESFPPSLITWTKSSDKNMHNGTETSQQNDTDTVPQEELGMAAFFISNVTAEDAGLYTCRVKYQNKTLMKTVDVTVIYMRNPVIAGNRTVTKGFPLSLACSVQSFPSSRITWTKLGSDTKLHDQTDPGLENDTTSSVLVIPSMTLQHAGQYVCTAQHLDTTVTASADVTVTWFYKILEDSGCTVQSEVLTCVCLSEGFPLPAITWPILEKQAEYTVVTTVSNHTVNSTVTLVVKEHSDASVECVSSCGNEEAKEQLTVERTNGQQSTTQPELGFSMKSWLQLIIAFLAGILLALVIFSFAKKCSRNKHKGSGTLDGTVEMVISQEDPLINAGAAVEDDQTFYQEAAEEEEEEVNVAAKQASPDLNGSPRDVEYASIDFSALRRKNQREKATKPETTETEYAEVKREVKKDKEDDGEQGGDAYEGKEEEAMVREEEETKPEEEEVYSTVRDIM